MHGWQCRIKRGDRVITFCVHRGQQGVQPGWKECFWARHDQSNNWKDDPAIYRTRYTRNGAKEDFSLHLPLDQRQPAAVDALAYRQHHPIARTGFRRSSQRRRSSSDRYRQPSLRGGSGAGGLAMGVVARNLLDVVDQTVETPPALTPVRLLRVKRRKPLGRWGSQAPARWPQCVGSSWISCC